MGPNAPANTSDTPPDLGDTQTPAPGVPAETTVPTAPDVSKADAIVHKVPDDAARAHNVEHDTHRDGDRNDSNQGVNIAIDPRVANVYSLLRFPGNMRHHALLILSENKSLQERRSLFGKMAGT